MNIIHLKAYHTNTKRFKHPLLKKLTPVSEEELNKLAADVLAGADPEALVLALRGCVSMLVGRYIGNFQGLEPYIDDMVSEGMAAVIMLCNDLPKDLVEERGILRCASLRAQGYIEKMLNKMRSLAAPSRDTQFKRIRNEEDPLYLQSETNEYSEMAMPMDDGDEWKRDVLDALSMIEREDEIDAALLDRFNWGRSYRELAKELGVGVMTIQRRKVRLYQKYLELTR